MRKLKLRQALLSEAKDKPKKNGKMLTKLHELDDKIEEFIDSLEDEIMSAQAENPVFVKKAQQLIADMSKEYSEFIMALRSVVNAADRKGQLVPSFEKQESPVRDIRDGVGGGGGAPPSEDAPPDEEEEDIPPDEDEGDVDVELKVAKKGGKKKKKGIKEALES